MSVKIMSRVWDATISLGNDQHEAVVRKMILLAMADYADDSGGGIWPSVATLAKKCSVSDRTIQRHLADMLKNEWLITDGRKPVKGGYVNVYRINFEAKWCHSVTGDTVTPVTREAFSGDTVSPNPYDPSEERETRETQPAPNRSGSLSAQKPKTITYSEADIPAHLRNQKAPPRKRKPFKAGAWKGYDPDPSGKHPAVKAYRRAFPFIRLTREETKALNTFKDSARFGEALTHWRKGVMQRGWNARNWRGIQETYDRLALRPLTNAADATKPTQQYQPVYN